jgi:hypothetical protein
MLKKALLFVLVAVMCVGLASAVFAADPKRTNATQKGSLLFWPKIDTSLSDDIAGIYRDTVIMLANDYFKQVWVKCYWMNSYQEIQDFMFPLTPNQPVWFRASDGLGTGYYDDVSNPITVPPFFNGQGVIGELKCWAVNAPGSSQISWNHLYGNAIVFDFIDGAAYEYNAWSFSTRGLEEGQRVGTEDEQGQLILSGNTGYYDACPKYIVANFFAAGAQIAWGDFDAPIAEMVVQPGTDLTVVPCKQDLRQDRIPTCSKLKFDIWNENETKYTGAYACFKCWFEDILGEIIVNGDVANSNPYGKYGFEKFNYETLHTTIGRFRTTGIKSTVCHGCPAAQVDTPVVAVIATPFVFGPDPFFAPDYVAYGGTNVHTAGNDPTGLVLWDTQEEPVDAAAR